MGIDIHSSFLKNRFVYLIIYFLEKKFPNGMHRLNQVVTIRIRSISRYKHSTLVLSLRCQTGLVVLGCPVIW
jgi:hypothetical protein